MVTTFFTDDQKLLFYLICDFCFRAEYVTDEDGNFDDNKVGELSEVKKWCCSIEVDHKFIDFCPDCYVKADKYL